MTEEETLQRITTSTYVESANIQIFNGVDSKTHVVGGRGRAHLFDTAPQFSASPNIIELWISFQTVELYSLLRTVNNLPFRNILGSTCSAR